MADPNKIYNDSFTPQEVERHTDLFESGFDEQTVIRTKNAKRTRGRADADSPFVNATRGRPLTPSAAQPASYLFTYSRVLMGPPPAKKAPHARAFGNGGGRRVHEPKLEESSFDVSLSESEAATNDVEAAFREGMRKIDAGKKSLSKKINSCDAVASKEIVEDGGTPAQRPIEYLSLAQASREHARKNVASLILEEDDLCNSSCDELEEKFRLEEEEERASKRRSSAKRPRKRATQTSFAPESIDVSAGGGASCSSNVTRDNESEDDDEDEKMNPGTSETFAQMRGEKRKRASASCGGDGDGGDGHTHGGGTQPGRNTRSALNCFLCRYGNRRYDANNKADMTKLLETLEEGIGHSDPVALAKTVHKQYMSTIFANGRMTGGRPLIWRTSSVLEHILYHENDPRFVLWLHIINTRRMIECCANTAFARDPTSGAVVPTRNAEIMLKHESQLMKLYSMKPETLNFFAPSSHANLARANRRVEGVVVRRQPRYYAQSVSANIGPQ